jgi:hypothetical protein
MGRITIRGMDPDQERKIRSKAMKSGKSINKTILEMIAKQTGAKRKKIIPHTESLRKMAGGWTKKYADEFMAAIKSCEQIDEEMWK